MLLIFLLLLYGRGKYILDSDTFPAQGKVVRHSEKAYAFPANFVLYIDYDSAGQPIDVVFDLIIRVRRRSQRPAFTSAVHPLPRVIFDNL